MGCVNVKISRKWISLLLAMLLILVLGLVILCFYAIYPKAPPIDCPNPANSWDKEKYIYSIHVSHNSGESVQVKNDEIGLVTQHIPYAKPTRKWTVNEFPPVEDYYTIEIAASSRNYLYHIYEEDSRVYIEDPYDGVYTIDGKILEIVASYFE